MGVAGALELIEEIVDERLPHRIAIFNDYAEAALNRPVPASVTNLTELLDDARLAGLAAPLTPFVVFIDEFANLAMGSSDRKQFETLVTRFVQMARAVGGHMIAATQRPNIGVVPGVMKTNFARLALSVPSAVDSRVILDSGGAESLLGKGDLLFRSPDGALVRLQGFSALGPYTPLDWR